jgi:two-component system, cell cycle sensor histidine kinase and response regulator CckA
MREANKKLGILVVDDEKAVRTWVGTVLKLSGYPVVEAASGPEALGILAGGGERPGLLLTDIRMPEMDGLELARRVKAEHPAVKVVYMTGFSCAVAEAGAAVLQKPFTSQLLLLEVAQALKK